MRRPKLRRGTVVGATGAILAAALMTPLAPALADQTNDGSGALPTAATPAVSSTPDPTSGVKTSDDIATAAAVAAQTGAPVEATELRTASSSTIANPDGTRTLRTFEHPVFAQSDGGDWVDVDTTLEQTGAGHWQGREVTNDTDLGAGGALAAGSSARQIASVDLPSGVDLRIASGKDLSNAQADGAQVTFGSDDASDNVEVTQESAGVEFGDVLSEAPAPGYSTSFLVDGGRSVHLKLAGNAIEVDQDGKGKVGTISAPTMYDAQINASGMPSNFGAASYTLAAGPGTTTKVTITPNAAFLADPSTEYPVSIDPSISSANAWEDSYVAQSDATNQNRYSLGYLGVGNLATNNTLNYGRIFLKMSAMPTVPAGAPIDGATLYLWDLTSGGSSTLDLYRNDTGWDQAYSSFNWNSLLGSSGFQYTYVANATTSFNTNTCGGPPQNSWVGFPITPVYNYWKSGGTNQGFMIKAHDESVTSYATQHYFTSNNYTCGMDHMDVVYETPPAPAVPSNVTVSDLDGANVYTGLPTYSAYVNDSVAGRSLGVNFLICGMGSCWWSSTTTTSNGGSKLVTWTMPIATDLDDGTYAVAVQVCDPLNQCTYSSGWSANFNVVTDKVTPPNDPTVPSDPSTNSTVGGSGNALNGTVYQGNGSASANQRVTVFALPVQDFTGALTVPVIGSGMTDASGHYSITAPAIFDPTSQAWANANGGVLNVEVYTSGVSTGGVSESAASLASIQPAAVTNQPAAMVFEPSRVGEAAPSMTASSDQVQDSTDASRLYPAWQGDAPNVTNYHAVGRTDASTGELATDSEYVVNGVDVRAQAMQPASWGPCTDSMVIDEVDHQDKWVNVAEVHSYYDTLASYTYSNATSTDIEGGFSFDGVHWSATGSYGKIKSSGNAITRIAPIRGHYSRNFQTSFHIVNQHEVHWQDCVEQSGPDTIYIKAENWNVRAKYWNGNGQFGAMNLKSYDGNNAYIRAVSRWGGDQTHGGMMRDMTKGGSDVLSQGSGVHYGGGFTIYHLTLGAQAAHSTTNEQIITAGNGKWPHWVWGNNGLWSSSQVMYNF